MRTNFPGVKIKFLDTALKFRGRRKNASSPRSTITSWHKEIACHCCAVTARKCAKSVPAWAKLLFGF